MTGTLPSLPPLPPLPPLLVLTDRTQVPAGRSLVEQVQGCIAGGARAVVLREKDLPRDERRALGATIKTALDAVGGRLIVASSYALAADLGAGGVHLSEADRTPGRAERRARKGFTGVTGASYHRMDELWQPSDFGWRYVTFSPVFATTSKPGYGPAIGTDGVAAAVAELAGYHDDPAEPPEDRVRLYALGGVETPELAADCIAAGADGVAVMGALMRATDPVTTTATFLASLLAATRSPQDVTT